MLPRKPTDIEAALIDSNKCPFCASNDNEVESQSRKSCTIECTECGKQWTIYSNGAMWLEG